MLKAVIVVRMNLDRQILIGIYELNEDREMSVCDSRSMSSDVFGMSLKNFS